MVVNEYVSYENDDNNINVSEDREHITGRSKQQCITLRLEWYGNKTNIYIIYQLYRGGKCY